MKYQSENEDLKDKLDFPEPSVPCECSIASLHLERANVGCRTLVAHQLHRLLPAAVNDLGDWLVGSRQKAAQLCLLLVWHSETHITQYVDKLVNGLVKVAQDESPVVTTFMKEAGMFPLQ